MKILILGGTVFLGKQLVRFALERNHEVCLFNRGIHNPDIFPEVEKIKGDRGGSLNELKGRIFDVVIDTSGHIPKDVERSAKILSGGSGNYVFVSSISAYKNFNEFGITENSETNVLTNGDADKMTIENYGALKVMCENEVMKAFKEKSLIVRPGLIVGDSDWSDRFTYWIHRVNKGGDVLAPDSKEERIQIIDVKDLAEWIVKMAEENKSGIYNATGPDYALTWSKFLDTCLEVTNSGANINWVSEEFLLKEEVQPWTEIPLWVPGEEQGVNNVSISKALEAGLTFRSLADTLADTLRFDKSRGDDYELRSGLKPAKEAELLKKWKAGV